MSVELARLMWMGEALHRVTILVAVEPAPLLRVIEHLFCRQLGFNIVARLSSGSAVAGQVARLRPDLVIANMRLLGQAADTIIREVKIASPSSKVIVTGFPHGFEQDARGWGADAYLEEEELVRRLVSTVHRLLKSSPSRKPASPIQPMKSISASSLPARPGKSSHSC